jgi:hypothetical protein
MKTNRWYMRKSTSWNNNNKHSGDWGTGGVASKNDNYCWCSKSWKRNLDLSFSFSQSYEESYLIL